MTRLRVAFVCLALLLTAFAVRHLWTRGDRENDATASRALLHGARVAVQAGSRTTVPVDVPMPATVVKAPAPVWATEVERRFAAQGASAAEIDVMKRSWPDWETRFSGATDDMVKAHVARVKPLVPVVIPNELSHVASVNIDDAIARSASAGDELAHVKIGAGASALDDVARGGARFGDDLLRLLGLGGAAAAAAGAAVLRKKK